MRISYRLEEADQMDATLTITMTIEQWEKLNSQLVAAYPSWKLSEKINKLIKLAHKGYWGEIDDE
jgi:hypothetical protein